MRDINETIFHQFIFEGDVILSARKVRVLRNLRRLGPLTEGVLATKCGEKVFMHEWTLLIAGLVGAEYIISELSGHGTTKKISITDKGEQFMEYQFGPKEVVEPEQPTEQSQE